MASWLHRQRKADLVELADVAGMEGAATDMRKDDLIGALEQHLHANASQLSNVPELQDYWNRVPSPIKKESETATSSYKESPAKGVRSRGRRAASSVGLETSPEPITDLLRKTPKAMKKAAQQTMDAAFEKFPSLEHLPASPADIANLVERRTSIIADQAQHIWYDTHINEHLNTARTGLSTVLAVQTLSLFLEAYNLQTVTMPWRFAFNLPALSPFTSNPTAIRFPDFFVLLTSGYWAPSLFWSFTNLLLPALFGWFFNFTMAAATKTRRGHAAANHYDIDPFVFSVAKMLIVWLVYQPAGVRFWGLISERTVAVVQSSMPFGTWGMLVNACVGASASLYEAVLKR